MSSLCFGSKFWFWRNWVASLIVVMLHYVICRLQLILILVAVGTLLTNTRWQYSILHRPWCVLSCVMAMRYEIYLILHVKNLWLTWGLNHLQQIFFNHDKRLLNNTYPSYKWSEKERKIWVFLKLLFINFIFTSNIVDYAVCYPLLPQILTGLGKCRRAYKSKCMEVFSSSLFCLMQKSTCVSIFL